MRNITKVLVFYSATTLGFVTAQAAVVIDGGFESESLPTMTTVNGNTQGLVYDTGDGRFENHSNNNVETAITVGGGWVHFNVSGFIIDPNAGRNGAGDAAVTLQSAGFNNINRGFVQYNRDGRATAGLRDISLDLYASHTLQAIRFQIFGFNENGTGGTGYDMTTAFALFGNITVNEGRPGGVGGVLGTPGEGNGALIFDETVSGQAQPDSIRGGGFLANTWQTYTFQSVSFDSGWDYYAVLIARTGNGGSGDDLRIDSIRVIPEPSNFAVLAGVLVMGYVLSRRR